MLLYFYYRTDIFGPDSRYLRIAMPTFGIRAKQGNAGLYTCRFCYTENLNQEVCIDQNINVNVIGREIKSTIVITGNCSM